MSNKPIPCIVGFGGITPAGRGSHNLSYSRMIYDLESEKNKAQYLKHVLSLCGLIDETVETAEIDKFTAILFVWCMQLTLESCLKRLDC